ncbi:MAG: rhodanese-like domain-containing protein, partial [Bacteriovorax sp.]
PNIDFFVLDVTQKSFQVNRLKEAIHIPLEELHVRFVEIPSKTVPVLVISENGLRSITACELLVKKGFFNINNISGGYEFWPGNETKDDPKKDDSQRIDF